MDADASGRSPEEARRATGPEPAATFPRFFQAVGLVALVLALQLGVGWAALLLDPTSGAYARHPLGLAAVNLLAIGAALLAVARRRGVEARAVLPFAAVPRGTLAPVAALTLGAAILLSDVDNLTRSVLPPPPELLEALASLLDTKEHPFGSFALLVVVAPATEEALFRGLVLSGFLAHYSKARAIALSALLFAALHVNPWQLVPAFVVGCLLAWLRIGTGSLTPCLFAHALFNGVAYLAASFPEEIPGLAGGAGGVVEFQPLWLDAAGAALVAIGYLPLRRTLRRTLRPPGARDRRSDPSA